MTKEEFVKKCEELRDKDGFKANFGRDEWPVGNGACQLYKVVSRTESGRASVILEFEIHHLESIPRASRLNPNHYTLVPKVVFSRVPYERVDLEFTSPHLPAPEMERIARSFGEWATQNIPLVASADEDTSDY